MGVYGGIDAQVPHSMVPWAPHTAHGCGGTAPPSAGTMGDHPTADTSDDGHPAPGGVAAAPTAAPVSGGGRMPARGPTAAPHCRDGAPAHVPDPTNVASLLKSAPNASGAANVAGGVDISPSASSDTPTAATAAVVLTAASYTGSTAVGVGTNSLAYALREDGAPESPTGVPDAEDVAISGENGLASAATGGAS